MFHERTKNFWIDYHFVCKKLKNNLVYIGYGKAGDQLGDMFTKALNGTQVNYICNVISMVICFPA